MENYEWQFLDEENYNENMLEENILNQEEDYLYGHPDCRTDWKYYYNDIAEEEIEY